MKKIILLLIFFTSLYSLSLKAQSDCFEGLKYCHLIEIEYNDKLKLPVFKSKHFKHLPSDVPIYLKLTSKEWGTFKIELDTVVTREFNPIDFVVPTTKAEKVDNLTRTLYQENTLFYLGMFEPGNQASFKLYRKKPRNEWDPLGSFAIQIPKKYRFRIRAGFSGTKYKTDKVDISSRTANVGDIENLSNDDLRLGFRQSQFISDTTTIYRVQNSSSKDWNFAPTLMLSIYPFAKKDLSANTSFFGSMNEGGFPKDFLSQSISFHIGTSINEDIFSDFYGGINFEVFEGVDFGVSYLSHTVQKLDKPYDYRNESLDGSVPYFTNSNAPESKQFISEQRVFDFSYSISVDASVFQKAFASVFNTIKKGITGG